MIVVLNNTVYRKHFLSEGFSANRCGPLCYSSFVFFFGVNLAHPSSIPIARRSDKKMWMNIFKQVLFFALFQSDFHNPPIGYYHLSKNTNEQIAKVF
jgi:hypothetical protein